MHATGLDAALNTFFNQLHHALLQEQEKKAELQAISDHRERITTAIRSIIATVDLQHRAHWRGKLRRMLGKADPLRGHQLAVHGTKRTRTIRAWLRDHGPIEFCNSDLVNALRQSGEHVDHHYVGTTLGRMAANGIVEKIGYGRYRVNLDHPALEEV
jgi:hypothetical protein